MIEEDQNVENDIDRKSTLNHLVLVHFKQNFNKSSIYARLILKYKYENNNQI